MEETFNEKDLLEALQKIYYGYDSKFMLPMCYDLVVAFIKELEKQIKEKTK